MKRIPTDTDPMAAVEERLHATEGYRLLQSIHDAINGIRALGLSDAQRKAISEISNNVTAMYVSIGDDAFRLGYETARDPSWPLFKEVGE